MSFPNIPNISPTIAITREDAINLLLTSIAMEELGLSHIFDAEGGKNSVRARHAHRCKRSAGSHD